MFYADGPNASPIGGPFMPNGSGDTTLRPALFLGKGRKLFLAARLELRKLPSTLWMKSNG
jgi:hypothetical protein